MIVATAGHVDHGKTSLVRALTGVDTDRLPEEKRRGMTIDLGFAYAGAIGFIDVPGHERFIHNMLAGVAGIDFALLVVAADDGVMPQTREHLAILDLLGVARGAVALTKIDRVASKGVDEAAAEVAHLLAGTGLRGAPIFPLSSVTGAGIEALRAHLDQVSGTIKQTRAGGNFRLSVDRCFTIAGAGLVVTGTAMSGAVAVGDQVRALLAGASARVRSIHAHNTPAERGRAGQRVALNLAGIDGRAPIARGDWIVAGNVPPPVRKFDARLKAVSELKHWTPVHVHLGAADVLGRVALLDENGLVQLVLDRPVGAAHGDRYIVRDQSARRTLGGGTVIDVFPPARGRAKPQRLAWLRAMELDDDVAALTALLESTPEGVDLARFSANRNLPAASGRRFAPTHWNALREKALATLAAWHRDFPERGAMPEDRLPKMVADELARDGLIVREGAGLRLAGHHAELSAADAGLWQKARPVLERGALRPPTIAELATVLGEDPRKLEAALARLAHHGLVVRVSKTRCFLPAMVRKLEEIAAEEARASGAITAAAFRDRSQIGRNLAIEVLEFFDRIKFTRRAGDAHVLLKNPGRDSHPGGAPGLQIQ
ncbi:MAG TPA: selenocysteine-specific translation elongation factor [Burkholderiales bacterium]